MDITFSPTERWSVDRESIIFSATADGQRVSCVVPQEFLTAPFVEKLNEQRARELFARRRSEIEGLLRERLIQGPFNSPGEIILHS